MDISVSVQKSDENYKEIMESLEFLKSHEVLIGIPENTKNRNGDSPVDNAELLFIHTNGSPANGIPPRPVLEPAIEHNQERVSAELKKAIDTALDGNKEGVLPALEHAGQYGQGIAYKWFTDSANGWKPNEPETVARKTPAIRNLRARARKAKNSETRKKLYAEANEAAKNTKAKPLIDTGEMRKSITYVVREVKR